MQEESLRIHVNPKLEVGASLADKSSFGQPGSQNGSLTQQRTNS